jgi:hypothetical protein
MIAIGCREIKLYYNTSSYQYRARVKGKGDSQEDSCTLETFED